ncbi:MAG: response regulator [Myxococcales bacterium]|nr:response regulator [Myxococcales bacterium]
MLRDGQSAMLLADLSMPGLDGLELARSIRADEAQSGAPKTVIIAVTGNAEPDIAATGTAAGMDGCVLKPLRLEALRELLDKWLPANP